MEIIRNVIRDIKPEYWVALGAAVSILSLMVAGFSLIYVRRAAKASREQTKRQKQAAKDAAQPMLWADVRGDDGRGQALVLLLEFGEPAGMRISRFRSDPPASSSTTRHAGSADSRPAITSPYLGCKHQACRAATGQPSGPGRARQAGRLAWFLVGATP
jgi:hypothetical protein